MVSVRGIGGVPEPAPKRLSDAVERRRAEGKDASAQDGVQISPEAKLAAEAARLSDVARQTEDIRPDKVSAAREKLEQGEYKRADVVATVAERISRYLEE